MTGRKSGGEKKKTEESMDHVLSGQPGDALVSSHLHEADAASVPCSCKCILRRLGHRP